MSKMSKQNARMEVGKLKLTKLGRANYCKAVMEQQLRRKM